MSFGMRIENGQIVSMQDGHMPNDFVGLDASKSANPGVGNVYKATDTGKEYICFVANLWSLMNSPCKTQYHNHTGETDLVAAMSAVGGSNSSGVPHVRVLTAGDGIHYYSSWRYQINVDPSTEYFIFNAKLGTITNGSEAGNQETVIGMSDEYVWFSNGNRIGCYFLQGYDGTWGVQTYDGTITQNDLLSSALVSGDDITIVGQKNRILYFVNGILIGNHTNGIAATALFPLAVCQAEDATVTTQRGLKVDYMGIEVMK